MTHPRREAQVKHLFPAASPEVSKEATGLGRHNLPPARTSFVGREHEVVEIKRVLPTTRLLTLTGAGGSGKTRLALEVAKDLLETYPDGVWLVELAGLSEGELGVQAVAAVLRVREQQRSLLWDTLVDYLRPKDVLLILDNCEHLIEATAPDRRLAGRLPETAGAGYKPGALGCTRGGRVAGAVPPRTRPAKPCDRPAALRIRVGAPVRGSGSATRYRLRAGFA